jgi:hypothetical protein
MTWLERATSVHTPFTRPHSCFNTKHTPSTHQHHQVTKDKDAAVRGQDFEKAGQLRDREMELKAKISAVIAGESRGDYVMLLCQD